MSTPPTSEAGPTSSVSESTSSESPPMQCGVCLEDYDLNESVPKILPCAHRFCLSCLNSIFTNSQVVADDARTLICPLCRQTHHITSEEIHRLPTDRRVLERLRSIQETQSQNVCSEHADMPLDYFCRCCEVPMCCFCVEELQSETENHDFIDMQQALVDYLPLFLNLGEIFKELSRKLKLKSCALAAICQQLEIFKRDAQIKLEESFAKYQRMLEQRKQDLLSQLDQVGLFDNETHKYEDQYDVITAASSDLEDWYDKFEWSRQNLIVTDLFSSFKKIQESESMFEVYADENVQHSFHICKFVSRNEDTFIPVLNELAYVERITHG